MTAQENLESTMAGKNTRPWPLQAAYGAALMLLLSVIVAIFPQINLLVSPGLPWFPIPMLAVALASVAWSHRLSAQTHDVVQPRTWQRQVWAGSLAAIALTIIGLTLTGWNEITAGHATLLGDSWTAPLPFRNSYSVTLGFVEGLTEEASIRGVVQLSIMGRLGSAGAQFVAGALFVCLHLLTRSGLAEFTFIGITAIFCGLLTSAFRSVWAPAVAHAMSNALIAIVVLVFRT
jgi:membrane protease YdiL (CAAX protease family)